MRTQEESHLVRVETFWQVELWATIKQDVVPTPIGAISSTTSTIPTNQPLIDVKTITRLGGGNKSKNDNNYTRELSFKSRIPLSHKVKINYLVGITRM